MLSSLNFCHGVLKPVMPFSVSELIFRLSVMLIKLPLICSFLPQALTVKWEMGERWSFLWALPSHLPLGPGADPLCPSHGGGCAEQFTRQFRPVVWTNRCCPLLFRSNPIIIRQGPPPDGSIRAQMLLGRSGGGSLGPTR